MILAQNPFCVFFFSYLDTGTFEPDEDCIMDVLYLARKYILPELVDDCEKLAKQLVDAESVWNIITKALQNHEETICDACLTFIRLHTSEVFKTANEIQQIKQNALEFVLDNTMLNTKEETIFQFCLAWAKEQLTKQHKKHTAPNIRKVLGACLFKIQFQNFTSETFTQWMDKTNLLDDKAKLQFYRCIGLGQNRKASDHPTRFELKQRAKESAQQKFDIPEDEKLLKTIFRLVSYEN